MEDKKLRFRNLGLTNSSKTKAVNRLSYTIHKAVWTYNCSDSVGGTYLIQGYGVTVQSLMKHTVKLIRGYIVWLLHISVVCYVADFPNNLGRHS